MATATKSEIVIDLDNLDTMSRDTAISLIKAEISTPELLANLIDGAELVDDCLVVEPGIWHAADESGYDVKGEFDSAEDAAESYVEGGEWGSKNKTRFVSVRAWREAIDVNGKIRQVDVESHDVALEPEVPACTEGEHDFQSPYEILGGLKENPGVMGSGGGVLVSEVCTKCGCGKHTDTWAQNPSNGVQGLRSVEYRDGEYAEELEAMRAEEAAAE